MSRKALNLYYQNLKPLRHDPLIEIPGWTINGTGLRGNPDPIGDNPLDIKSKSIMVSEKQIHNWGSMGDRENTTQLAVTDVREPAGFSTGLFLRIKTPALPPRTYCSDGHQHIQFLSFGWDDNIGTWKYTGDQLFMLNYYFNTEKEAALVRRKSGWNGITAWDLWAQNDEQLDNPIYNRNPQATGPFIMDVPIPTPWHTNPVFGQYGLTSWWPNFGNNDRLHYKIEITLKSLDKIYTWDTRTGLTIPGDPDPLPYDTTLADIPLSSYALYSKVVQKPEKLLSEFKLSKWRLRPFQSSVSPRFFKGQEFDIGAGEQLFVTLDLNNMTGPTKWMAIWFRNMTEVNDRKNGLCNFLRIRQYNLGLEATDDISRSHDPVVQSNVDIQRRVLGKKMAAEEDEILILPFGVDLRANNDGGDLDLWNDRCRLTVTVENISDETVTVSPEQLIVQGATLGYAEAVEGGMPRTNLEYYLDTGVRIPTREYEQAPVPNYNHMKSLRTNPPKYLPPGQVPYGYAPPMPNF